MDQESFTLTLVKTREAILLRLREEARKLGMAELGRRCGIDASNLGKVIGDDANPTLDSLLRIAIALKIQIDLKTPERKKLDQTND